MTLRTPTSRLALSFLVVLCLPFLVSSASSSSVSLNQQNFDEVTAGKTVFIKWFAPWCGHCQELAPAWERLASTFESKAKAASGQQGLIAEVDCTTTEETQTWCQQMGITGFPTLTYGDASHKGVFLEEYNDDKDFQSLLRFAETTLQKPFCSPGNVDACEDDTKATIYEYWNMSNSELESSIQEKEMLIKEADNKFKAHAKSLQTSYDEASRQYELTQAKLRRQLRLYKDLALAQEARRNDA
jgi:thiol-disulfide isomerase/thioredoxin